MPGRTEFEFRFASSQRGALPDSSMPMRILVLGDFSAAQMRSSSLAERAPRGVDIDNLDEVLRRIAPRCSGADGTTFALASFDEFHPDYLYRELELFKALRQMRKRLQDPVTAAQALAELQPRPGPGAAQPTSEHDADTFARLLGRAPAEPAPRAAAGNALEQLLRNLVAPHVVHTTDTRSALVGVDTAITEQMRALLHQPEWQAVEALWRGLQGLLSRIETGDELRVYLLDAGKLEWLADLARAGGDPDRTVLHRLLVEESRAGPDAEPWALVIGAYEFGATTEDLRCLELFGHCARQAGVPFVAAAAAGLLGCESLQATPDPADWQPLPAAVASQWQALRASPIAHWIGLALPRLLLRAPYGARSDAIEAFAFEELTAERRHQDYLWGNPAFACAQWIAAAFTEQGWDLRLDGPFDLIDLPTHVYQERGEKKLLACAEIFLSERAAQAMTARGIMALQSYRDRNTVRLRALHSIAADGSGLAGPWRH